MINKMKDDERTLVSLCGLRGHPSLRRRMCRPNHCYARNARSTQSTCSSPASHARYHCPLLRRCFWGSCWARARCECNHGSAPLKRASLTSHEGRTGPSLYLGLPEILTKE
ncbi:hypothetical protein H112_08524 [Trichophyton rubrum D6]|uniref:Uncharacterized protein n=3 Tax=Trichophyton TaxID=5550 RepID=A0A080WIM5_TRIRC|nr:uncharacterized protein TERG_11679 [Trichophyton rubrum CBS 118892]EZF10159.1 hypothetical protein H100_08547 [Trichophyton rubrum MR850]EZF37020.1 hypothetical protein H102_08506 [Trichophyton rubrum CBS 100081]EZF47795.1 hypothetical protein H103_08528 [Trichophyton rubrum CBS 288.86]EZF58312.1 hypothetical protein H104_08480 [Trichophyton rubrum CBS 289.86]EZF68991.1 hypothetical protein H105_08534 [Trichophyton soudanense CBS 452.61]EZF79598.1 hypothetical protein H110_08530 [Trichophy